MESGANFPIASLGFFFFGVGWAFAFDSVCSSSDDELEARECERLLFCARRFASEDKGTSRNRNPSRVA